MLLSIIIPVYNAEKYLDFTLKSVLAQTFSDFELLLIDDGSTDKSGAICDRFAEADSRITVIHKQNSGVSDARNVGLAVARGDYIGWVDSDDLIEPDMFEKLITAALKENADIVQCEHDRNEALLEKSEEFSYNKVTACQLIDTQFTLTGGRCTNFLALWSKVFKRSLFEGLCFPSGRTHEDHALMCRIVMNAEVILTSSQVFYHYVKRQDSIITGFSAKKHRDITAALYDNIVYLKDYNAELYVKAVQSYKNCLFRHSAYFYNNFRSEGEHRYYWRLIAKHRHLISKGASCYDRLYIFLISVGLLRRTVTKNEFAPIQRLISHLRGE